MKKLIIAFLSAAVLCTSGIAVFAAFAAGDDFDVSTLLNTDEHMAYVSGYDSVSRFYPDRQITRAEASQIFYNLLREKPNSDVSFSDVSDDSWYKAPISALAGLDIIQGYPDGSFKPDSPITRAEFITVASRFTTSEPGNTVFPDVSEDHWAYPAVVTALSKGWINGYSDGTFHPSAQITRAEAVTIVNRMLGRSADPDAATIRSTRRFIDVPGAHWAFGNVCEAATEHDYYYDGIERWVYLAEPDGSGWVESDGSYYYLDPNGDGYLTGFNYIAGYTYYFDEETCKLISGWQEIDGAYYLLPDRDAASRSLEIRDILTLVNYYDLYRGYGSIRYIVMHYTAVPGDLASNEAWYFYDKYRGSSSGYFVDDNEIVRCVLDEDVAWHCGSDYYFHDGCYNTTSIGIEMTSEKVDSSNFSSPYAPDWYFTEATLQNSAALVRELMMRYGIPIENVVRHNDVSHKVCPAPMTNDFSKWQSFLALVTQGNIDYNGYYQVSITADELTIRSGPGYSYDIVDVLWYGDVVTVYDETGRDNTGLGRWVKVDGGWINYRYVLRLGA